MKKASSITAASTPHTREAYFGFPSEFRRARPACVTNRTRAPGLPQRTSDESRSSFIHTPLRARGLVTASAAGPGWVAAVVGAGFSRPGGDAGVGGLRMERTADFKGCKQERAHDRQLARLGGHRVEKVPSMWTSDWLLMSPLAGARGLEGLCAIRRVVPGLWPSGGSGRGPSGGRRCRPGWGGRPGPGRRWRRGVCGRRARCQGDRRFRWGLVGR